MTWRPWSMQCAGRGAHCGQPFTYAIGWDRLGIYRRHLLRERRVGPVSSINLYAGQGVWDAELDILRRRGEVTLIVSSEDRAESSDFRPLRVKRYTPRPDVHLHVKADVFATAVRLSTAHLATRRLGPFVLGMRGLGRTEMYAMTTHPGVVAEAHALVGQLERDELPRSGRYCRFETPCEDAILPSICRDIERLTPGTGSIVHVRTNCYPHRWKRAGQRLDSLQALHTLIEQAALRGTETFVAYGELTAESVERLRRFTECGAHVGIPSYFPGSFIVPYRLRGALRQVRALRPFKMAEHINVTIIDGLRDDGEQRHAIVYIGHKSDIPYDAGTLELMLRCDTREFEGQSRGLRRLIDARTTWHTRETFQAIYPRLRRDAT